LLLLLLLLLLDLFLDLLNDLLEALGVLKLGEVLKVIHVLDLVVEDCIQNDLVLQHIIQEETPHEVEPQVTMDLKPLFLNGCQMSLHQVLRDTQQLLQVVGELACHNLLDELLKD
jgi:hypothetical protein